MTHPSTSGAASEMGLDLSQFHAVFFEEASDNLSSMESQLLELDTTSPDGEQLNAIFRCAHSIKGGAATFGFTDVAELTHVMETLLDRLRRREMSITTAMVDTLLESGDALRALLAGHQSGGGAGTDHGDLVAKIRMYARDGAACAAHPEAPRAAHDGEPRGAAAVAMPATATEAEAEAQSAGAGPDGGAVSGQAGERVLDARIGPLDRPETAELLCELFRDIPGLGRIEPADNGSPDGTGCRHFRIVTNSSDEDLFDLFSFHVAREAVQLVPAAPRKAVPGEAATLPGRHEPEAAGAGMAGESRSPAGGSGEALAANPAGQEDADPGWGLFDGAAGLAGATSSPAAQASASAREGSRGTRGGTSPTEGSERAARGGDRGASPESSTLRVSVDKVDQLINLVGELVITQAMLAQAGRGLDPIEHQGLMSSMVDLERNTRLLQESVMAIRMIPMATVFNRFPRMLRDLAGKLGKQVEMVTIGESTELDKGMVEKITDPLTHLVRNAVDHGIEPPEERRASGKPPGGTLTLSARHRGGSVVIEVRDDGRGLNRDKLISKAIERGIPASPDMSDADAWSLIFEPGFSTAEVVTDVSGRGVGMDVVRKNITSLGGSVEIDSAPGYGTRISVRLPLTLAITDGMSVGVADETYIVPLAAVVESINLDARAVRSLAGSERILEVRGEYLPVVKLEEVFDVPRRREDGSPNATVIVVESDNQRVAVLVDELIGQHQVVVKNLEANYHKVQGVSGATIMGDGRVALIIDVAHLVRRARH